MVFSHRITSCNHNPKRIRKIFKDFVKTRDFKDMHFLVKIRDIYKIKKKKEFCRHLEFSVMKNNKSILITFMSDDTLHRASEYFCGYCLQVLVHKTY